MTLPDEGRRFLLACMPQGKTLAEIPTRELEHYARRIERVLRDERVQRNLLHNIHKYHDHVYPMRKLIRHTQEVMREINLVLISREDSHVQG